jgi:hypothetical protein
MSDNIMPFWGSGSGKIRAFVTDQVFPWLNFKDVIRTLGITDIDKVRAVVSSADFRDVILDASGKTEEFIFSSGVDYCLSISDKPIAKMFRKKYGHLGFPEMLTHFPYDNAYWPKTGPDGIRNYVELMKRMGVTLPIEWISDKQIEHFPLEVKIYPCFADLGDAESHGCISLEKMFEQLRKEGIDKTDEEFIEELKQAGYLV